MGYASKAKVVKTLRLLTKIKNLNNIKYDITKIYGDSKKSEPDDSKLISSITSNKKYNYAELVNPNIKDHTKSNEFTDNLINIGSIYKIQYINFNSLCLLYVTNIQTQIVIWNKPITKVDKKFDKIYMDFWRLYYSTSIKDKTYATILLNIIAQKTWVIYLLCNNEFVNIFQIWLQKVENKSNKSMKVFCIDRKENFISKKLKNICIKKSNIIKYTIPYIYEKNRLIEQRWKTIMIMKDLLLVDNGFLPEFWVEAIDSPNSLLTKRVKEES